VTSRVVLMWVATLPVLVQYTYLCDCSREKKIPMIELAFIKGQREKVGSIGPHQIGPVDLPENRRQLLQNERQEKRRDDEKNGE